jgi:hypothetical protein
MMEDYERNSKALWGFGMLATTMRLTEIASKEA